MKHLRLKAILALMCLSFPVASIAADHTMRPSIRLNSEVFAQITVSKSLAPQESLRPNRRAGDSVTVARWDHRPAGRISMRAAISALRSHGKPILQTVPRDIADWCPAYPEAGEEQGAAFRAGVMLALTKHESTHLQDAVGGNGRWYGSLQILPATVRDYKCSAPSREGLKHGPSNLACAVRILTVVMPRDKVMASKDKRWRWVAGGLGADAHQLQTQRYRRMDAQTGILPEFEISATTTAARCLGHQCEMMPFVGDVLGF
jgi:hypothetical protein